MWRNVITALYPDTLHRTYCVPPVHFNIVPYVKRSVPGTGQFVFVLHPPSGGVAPVHEQPPVRQKPTVQQTTEYSLWTWESQSEAKPFRVQESDIMDDAAQHRVLINLHQLGRAGHEVMFIISQMKFSDYLNKPSYAASAEQFPRPGKLPLSYCKGDFDILVIHRRYGILVGELKSVGKNQEGSNWTQIQADAAVAKKVKQAFQQLDKSEKVVKYLVSDMAGGKLMVKKTLFLPYVSSLQLERVIAADPKLEQVACERLGASNAVEAAQLCCCSDQLSDPAALWHVTPALLPLQLSSWWRLRMARTVDPHLNDNTYLDILGRIASGPRLTRFLKTLIERVPKLHFWTAGVNRTGIPPQLQAEVLTTPLRCAPVVLREVRQGVSWFSQLVHDYSETDVPHSGDGLRVTQLCHQGNGHTGLWPVQCLQCGKMVADELHRLGVGQGGNHISHRDVFILTRSKGLQDDVRDEAGNVTSEASDVVQGLRAEGLPVRVLGWELARSRDVTAWERDVADTATAKTDHITVADYRSVKGRAEGSSGFIGKGSVMMIKVLVIKR